MAFDPDERRRLRLDKNSVCAQIAGTDNHASDGIETAPHDYKPPQPRTIRTDHAFGRLQLGLHANERLALGRTRQP